MINKIYRGDIYLADLNPILGCEQGGIRPVLVVQNDSGNCYSTTTIVVSITSNINKRIDLPTHVFIDKREGLLNDSLVLCEQIRTIDKSRLIKYLGCLNDYELEEVEEALNVSIGCFNDIDKNLQLHM